MLAAKALTPQQWAIVIAVIVVLAIVLTAAIIVSVKTKKAKNSLTEKVKVVDGVRYSVSEVTEKPDGDINVTHNQGDLVVSKGETVIAVKNGKVMPGKYKVLSANENDEKFNLRVGGFVREYSHGDNIVLGEGDELTAVSHTVILR